MEVLKKQIENKSYTQAYIFEGENLNKVLENTYKFAKEIFKINNVYVPLNQNDDFRLINASEKRLSIEDIRYLISDMNLRPENGKVKIYVIHNAQNSGKEAMNALLKSFEEPNDYAVIILTTLNSNMLFPTIRSRAQIIKFDLDLPKTDIDTTKLANILAETVSGNLVEFYKNLDFFDSLKDEKNELLNEIENFFEDLIKYKYLGDDSYLKNKTLIFYYKKIKNIEFKNIEKIISLIEKIKKGFLVNANYKLSLENFFFQLFSLS
ncbi:MAG: DNA polymerase III subunit delta' [Peptoniphilaceae bacterium]|nr:DNA polymerase III subunit delta' [Peptoniphilaceae bacterium]MDD7383314.1 DNA polymerase III subunit delta' [Peptoniphilaceae bacterium]MDY3738315.1 DNA polymerase III subunit delta' [Peptoniphilaceae bacterium]